MITVLDQTVSGIPPVAVGGSGIELEVSANNMGCVRLLCKSKENTLHHGTSLIRDTKLCQGCLGLCLSIPLSLTNWDSGGCGLSPAGHAKTKFWVPEHRFPKCNHCVDMVHITARILRGGISPSKHCTSPANGTTSWEQFTT